MELRDLYQKVVLQPVGMRRGRLRLKPLAQGQERQKRRTQFSMEHPGIHELEIHRTVLKLPDQLDPDLQALFPITRLRTQ
jgi:hypothetical protein